MRLKPTQQGIDAATLIVDALVSVPETEERILQELTALRSEVEAIRRSLPPTLTSVADAATRLGLTSRTVRRMLVAGKLRSVRIGETVRVDLRSIQEALMLRASALER